MDFPKNSKELAGLVFLTKAIRFARPLLGMLGLNVDRKLLDETIGIGETLMTLTDEFNPAFASRGWIACNAINTHAAKEALQAAAEERWDDADEILAAAYSPEMVRVHLAQLKGLRCFRNRVPLALLALDDYEAGRYHACVPVTLALLDGMGQELTGANFFRNTRHIKVKESFVEIGPGVSELLKVMSRPRQSTTTEGISIPFRHGILHGTDLGYNNRIVAAKAWAALLAVGHYAADYLAPEPEPQPRLLEALRQHADTKKRLDAMEADLRRWLPRTDAALAALVAAGQFEPGSPEGAVMEVFSAWRAKKFGVVARRSYDSIKTDVNALAGKIRRVLGPAPVEATVVSIADEAAATSTVNVSAIWDGGTEEIILRLNYYKDGEIAPRTTDGGRWLVGSLWPLESAGRFDNTDTEQS